MSLPLPSLDALKTQAKALRQSLAASGHEISHSQSLELLSKQMGYRDWNTLHARTGNTPPIPFHLGQRCSGSYLGKAFEGEVIAVSGLAGNSRFSLTIRFDEAVDVIPFEHLSNFRKQVKAVVGPDGKTVEKTSNGLPHMVLDMNHRRR